MCAFMAVLSSLHGGNSLAALTATVVKCMEEATQKCLFDIGLQKKVFFVC